MHAYAVSDKGVQVLNGDIEDIALADLATTDDL